LSEIQDENLFVYRVPADVDRFVFEYEHSEFVECDHDLARKHTSSTYQQDMVKNYQALSLMTYVTDYLVSLGKHYRLSSGTLLGWYRDCGMIPHTTDIDIMLLRDEYEGRIKKHFVANERAHLNIVYGMRNHTYEMRVRDDHLMIDLFVPLIKNRTHMGVGLFIERRKYM
jgi:hypothetical protein